MRFTGSPIRWTGVQELAAGPVQTSRPPPSQPPLGASGDGDQPSGLPRRGYRMPQPGSGSGLPSWAPTVSDVAKYVPHRTLEVDAQALLESDDTYDLTFTTNTRPPAEAVLKLIADGCAWVQ